ncbi:MAG: Fn3-like domain-containing protein [Elusimicrobiota bacterium]
MNPRNMLAATLVWCLAASAGAASISSTFSEILVENLQPGQKYSLQQIANFPYNLQNGSGEDINVKIEVIKPRKANLRPDFEVIPDTSWVTLQYNAFDLAPDQTKTSDVMIQIPEKSKYLNKKYQVSIWSRTVNSGGGFGVSTGLESILLITTDKEFIKEIGTEAKSPEPSGLNFQVKPREMIAADVITGKPVDLFESDKIILKVTNSGNKDVSFKIKSLTAKEALTKLREGYLDCPDSSFLSFSEPEFTLPAGGEKNVKLTLCFPPKTKFKNKKYMFVVYTMCGETGGIYSRLLVETK